MAPSISPNPQGNTSTAAKVAVIGLFFFLTAGSTTLSFVYPGAFFSVLMSAIVSSLSTLFTFYQIAPRFILQLRRPHTASSRWFRALVSVLLLLILVNSGVLYLNLRNESPTSRSQSSSPGNHRSQGTLAFVDPMTFLHHGDGWDTRDESGSGEKGAGNCDFEADGYHIRADKNYKECVDGNNTTLSNFELEARITFLTTDRAGFILRRDPGTSGGDYVVEFATDGCYTVYEDPTNVKIGEGCSSSITRYRSSYLIDVVCVGRLITLSVDSIGLAHILVDNTYHDGEIGFYGTAHADPPVRTEVVISSVTLRYL